MIAEGSLGSTFAALAAEQADKAVRSLARRSNQHLAVHAARKAIRRLRSILCLCREALGPDVAGIDRKCKRLDAGLSDPRDAHVVATTARGLAKKHDDDLWREVAAQLEDRRGRLLKGVLSGDPDFGKRRSRLGALAQAIAALPWGNLTTSHLREGIRRSRHRVARAQQASERVSSLANRHRWRRRLRRLRMQLQAIQAAGMPAPTLEKIHAGKGHASIRALSKLSEELGRLQDLRMLRSRLNVLDESLPLTLLRSRLRTEMHRASV
jgi:CHAD domain-containing protein